MTVSNLFDELGSVFSGWDFLGFFNKILPTLIVVIVILFIFKTIQVITIRMVKGRVSDQQSFLLRKIIRYTAFVVVIMTVFNKLGIDLSALLGAAGIAGIAIGFAAQTSISNIISGLFLIYEKPFQVGDVIQVGDVSGIVQGVDSLSVKIQTFDNRFIRIPNETIIKSNVINVTRYPIRRLDLWVSVAYGTDLEKVKTLLLDVAGKNVYALDNPEPLILFDKFDASGINILLGLWFEKSNYLNLKNSILLDVHTRFAQEGIEIPYPKMDVYMKEG